MSCLGSFLLCILGLVAWLAFFPSLLTSRHDLVGFCSHGHLVPALPPCHHPYMCVGGWQHFGFYMSSSFSLYSFSPFGLGRTGFAVLPCFALFPTFADPHYLPPPPHTVLPPLPPPHPHPTLPHTFCVVPHLLHDPQPHYTPRSQHTLPACLPAPPTCLPIGSYLGTVPLPGQGHGLPVDLVLGPHPTCPHSLPLLPLPLPPVPACPLPTFPFVALPATIFSPTIPHHLCCAPTLPCLPTQTSPTLPFLLPLPASALAFLPTPSLTPFLSHTLYPTLCSLPCDFACCCIYFYLQGRDPTAFLLCFAHTFTLPPPAFFPLPLPPSYLLFRMSSVVYFMDCCALYAYTVLYFCLLYAFLHFSFYLGYYSRPRYLPAATPTPTPTIPIPSSFCALPCVFW